MRKLYIKFPLLLLGMVSLIAGIWAALYKMGWIQSEGFSSFPSFHGALMVSGFLGTLISLERALVLGAAWGFLAPLLSGLGALGLMISIPSDICVGLFTASSLLYLAVSLAFLRRLVNLAVWLLIFSAIFWLLGNLTWLVYGWDFRVILWWIGFLLITITGERFELAHLILGSKSRFAMISFCSGVLVFFAGMVGNQWGAGWGFRLSGLGMICLASWLLRYDLAKVGLRQTGLHKFMAVCLITGYIWLLFAGIIATLFSPVQPGFLYDAALHAFFLGFIMSMIFAHAPIIFPGITGFMMPFHGRFYIHYFILQLSLFLRVGSALVSWKTGYEWGGLLNAASILIFIANTVSSSVRKQG